jgi:hypothetical protein
MRSSANGVIPWMTMFGRNRDMGIDSIPLPLSRRFRSSSEASEAINLVKRKLLMRMGTL